LSRGYTVSNLCAAGTNKFKRSRGSTSASTIALKEGHKRMDLRQKRKKKKAKLNLRVVIRPLWSRVIWQGKVQSVKLYFWTLAKTGKWLYGRENNILQRKMYCSADR
jgi:DNA-binding Xre family transcriptional regulator